MLYYYEDLGNYNQVVIFYIFVLEEEILGMDYDVLYFIFNLNKK